MNTSNIYQKHLNLSKRIKIEQLLNEGRTIKEIAEEISKSKNTVYYEIKNHRQFIKCNSFNTTYKYCSIRFVFYVFLSSIISSFKIKIFK